MRSLVGAIVVVLGFGASLWGADDPAPDYEPAWSPQGTHLVFVSERDGNPEIYLMAADGSNLRRLTDNTADDSEPAWSP